MLIACDISKISYELQSSWAVLRRMKDTSMVALEGLVFSCMEGGQRHKAGGRGCDPAAGPPRTDTGGDQSHGHGGIYL